MSSADLPVVGLIFLDNLQSMKGLG